MYAWPVTRPDSLEPWNVIPILWVVKTIIPPSMGYVPHCRMLIDRCMYMYMYYPTKGTWVLFTVVMFPQYTPFVTYILCNTQYIVQHPYYKRVYTVTLYEALSILCQLCTQPRLFFLCQYKHCNKQAHSAVFLCGVCCLCGTGHRLLNALRYSQPGLQAPL